MASEDESSVWAQGMMCRIGTCELLPCQFTRDIVHKLLQPKKMIDVVYLRLFLVLLVQMEDSRPQCHVITQIITGENLEVELDEYFQHVFKDSSTTKTIVAIVHDREHFYLMEADFNAHTVLVDDSAVANTSVTVSEATKKRAHEFIQRCAEHIKDANTKICTKRWAKGSLFYGNARKPNKTKRSLFQSWLVQHRPKLNKTSDVNACSCYAAYALCTILRVDHNLDDDKVDIRGWFVSWLIRKTRAAYLSGIMSLDHGASQENIDSWKAIMDAWIARIPDGHDITSWAAEPEVTKEQVGTEAQVAELGNTTPPGEEQRVAEDAPIAAEKQAAEAKRLGQEAPVTEESAEQVGTEAQVAELGNTTPPGEEQRVAEDAPIAAEKQAAEAKRLGQEAPVTEELVAETDRCEEYAIKEAAVEAKEGAQKMPMVDSVEMDAEGSRKRFASLNCLAGARKRNPLIHVPEANVKMEATGRSIIIGGGRNMVVPENFDPSPFGAASLPGLDDLCNSHLALDDAEKLVYFWYGAMLFAFVRSDDYDLEGVKRLLRKRFYPVAPNVAFRCHHCPQTFYNPVQARHHETCWEVNGMCRPGMESMSIAGPPAFYLPLYLLVFLEGWEHDRLDLLDACRVPVGIVGKPNISTHRYFPKEIFKEKCELQKRKSLAQLLTHKTNHLWGSGKGQAREFGKERFRIFPELPHLSFLLPLNMWPPELSAPFFAKYQPSSIGRYYYQDQTEVEINDEGAVVKEKGAVVKKEDGII
jgi:hypothetical protein